jgi:hypothetical protein
MTLDVQFRTIDGKVYFEKNEVIKILLSILPYTSSTLNKYISEGIEDLQKVRPDGTQL